jgi:hypothetical protein
LFWHQSIPNTRQQRWTSPRAARSASQHQETEHVAHTCGCRIVARAQDSRGHL